MVEPNGTYQPASRCRVAAAFQSRGQHHGADALANKLHPCQPCIFIAQHLLQYSTDSSGFYGSVRFDHGRANPHCDGDRAKLWPLAICLAGGHTGLGAGADPAHGSALCRFALHHSRWRRIIGTACKRQTGYVAQQGMGGHATRGSTTLGCWFFCGHHACGAHQRSRFGGDLPIQLWLYSVGVAQLHPLVWTSFHASGLGDLCTQDCVFLFDGIVGAHGLCTGRDARISRHVRHHGAHQC